MSHIKASADYVDLDAVPAKSNAASRWSFGNLIVWSAFFVLIVAFVVHRASEQRVDL